MNAIEITKKLNQSLIDYLLTTFDVNKDGKEPELAFKIRESLYRQDALFKGPFLEFIHPYKTASSINELINEGTLSPKLSKLQSFSLERPEPLPIDAPLYFHQEKAIKKLCIENASIVISSGTGSGKTECFLLPIINDLLEDDTSGVRALLVYPLNALVNDQLDRLRILLKGTNITFGKYTGELPQQAERSEDTLPNEIISRAEIQVEGKLPQILITNYAMLEYLLLRPEDSILFDTGKWKYLVLDEAHTYSGAQGIEVSMLIRRLKQRLGKSRSEIQCVATSATLVNDDIADAVEFAKRLFDEKLGPDDIIFGEINKIYPKNNLPIKNIPSEVYADSRFEKIINELRSGKIDLENIALEMFELGILDEEETNKAVHYGNDWSAFLFEVLSKNSDLIKLRNWMIDENRPVEVQEAANFVFPNLDTINRLDALYHLIELGAAARPDMNKLSLLPAKYHLFGRPPQGIWVCINPACRAKEYDHNLWSYLYSSPHETCDYCEGKVYPIHLCRQCGQIFIAMVEDDNYFLPRTEQINNDGKKAYFSWNEIIENQSLGENSEENDEENEENSKNEKSEPFSHEKIILCLRCGKTEKRCSCEEPIKSIPLFRLMKKEIKKRKGGELVREIPVEDIQICPRCKSKAKKDTEIVTPLMITGTAPLANLTYELYRQLPESNNLKLKKRPGSGRKMLSFYDSRQGAARFAAFLQDVSNKQNYRHIIPKAIQICVEENGYEPSLDGLSKTCVDLAWDNRVIQNDSDSEYWRTSATRFSREERAKNQTHYQAQILGEFTTGSRSRQSLEQMGLVGINYFEEDGLPNFELLADELNLSVEKTKTLVEYLLDELRYQKAVELPAGIEADDPFFGGNPVNPRVIRQGKPDRGEIPWVGATPRQRRRKYVELVLRKNDLNSDDHSVIKTLNTIWKWLINETDVFKGEDSSGYQLRTSRLFFMVGLNWFQCTKCQRLFYRGDSLPCPSPECGGDLKAIDINVLQKNNYFYNLFSQTLIPMRVEEHTAQLDPEKGRAYQNYFKDGHINVLSCSTTFEMGIDLGDLQTVVLSNVPPSVANYRQRAGRAGRRTSGTAFILTWAANRPHDQAHYENPSEIIDGNVTVPNIVLENPFIIQRHVNAILFSMFMRYLYRNRFLNLKFCGDFFDFSNSDLPHISQLDNWVNAERNEIKNRLIEFAEMIKWNEQEIIDSGLEKFLSDLRKVHEENYQAVISYYNREVENLAEKSKDPALNGKKLNALNEKQNYFIKLRERMRRDLLIDYLSKKGILPSYSFPLHTVELMLPKIERKTEHLRLDRDLRQAIREFAPGSEVVADKRIWKSQRPVFWRNTVKEWQYDICDTCQNLSISQDAGLPIKSDNGLCEICGTQIKKPKKYVEPDGFKADPKSGQPAKQYVKIEPSLMRSALLPVKNLEEQQISNLIYVGYERKGQLLYVNEGNFGRGFKLSLDGFNLDVEEVNIANYERFSLGHVQTTDTLHIRFSNGVNVHVPDVEDQSFWLSLMYAIIQAASYKLQIERKDIDGVLAPRKMENNFWEQTIVLFDNVPGGAGHVKNIKDNLIEVLKEAQRVLNCVDCASDTSCYHCLKDYNNQLFHQFLRRDKALAFLDLLLGEDEHTKVVSEIPNAFRLVTPNPTVWLMKRLEEGNVSIDIALDQIHSGHPYGDNYSWIDTINKIISTGCEVNIYLQDLPGKTSEGLSNSRYLQVLMEKGLKLWQINEIPKVQILLNKNSLDKRAIWSETNEPIQLGESLGCKNLLSTISNDGVIAAVDLFNQIKKRRVDPEELNPPENTRVINIPNQQNSSMNEESLFAQVFDAPITQILVHDPYLFSREQIVDRLGAYVDLASQHSTLKRVNVITKRAPQDKKTQQDKAEDELNKRYHGIINFQHKSSEHDRYIILERESGAKARIIIGKGLDFIRNDGEVNKTYVIIEDPWNET